MKNSRLVLALLVISGCTTLRGRADSAYSKGKYLDAIAMYDQILHEHPNDADARKHRTQAVEAELHVEVVAVQNARVTNPTGATGLLAALLTRRDEWRERLSPQLTQAIGFEVSSASARIGGEVAQQTASQGPLAGEHAASAYAQLLEHADFKTTRAALQSQLSEAGHARCGRLAHTANTPYWTWLVSRYCDHWGIARPVPTLPDQRTRLDVDGTIAGENARESAELHDLLSKMFEKSAWYASNAPKAAHAKVDGELRVAETARDVTLTASWTDQVPYTDYETTRESYQEPYDDTENYSEQVPTTEYHTETVQCGDTTCTNSVPETVYHTEYKTRTVTKYRTAYRDVTNPVTKYRDVPRTQQYAAVERHATYTDKLRAHIDAGLPRLDATIELSTAEQGFDHDVTIAPAGVGPSRANLTTQEDFAQKEHERLAVRMVEILDHAYVQEFCTLPQFTLEQASECAYAGAGQLSVAARDTLHEALGGEEPYLSAITR